jgi:glutaredoxin
VLKVYGKANCSSCIVAKNVLTEKGIPFEYIDMSTLPKEEQKTIKDWAKRMKQLSLPILVLADNIVNLQEVIK